MTEPGTRRALREQQAAAARPAGSPSKHPRSFWRALTGVVGELLLTAGVLVLAFIGWKFWINDAQVNAVQAQAAQTQANEWAQAGASADQSTDSTATPSNPSIQPSDHEVFGIVYAERFGTTWQRPIARGIEKKPVLDSIGAGWYPTTQLPGQVGNFAIAAHRGGQGSGFRDIHELRVGDKITIETRDGWYVYDYRNTEYVMDTQGDVVNPVPRQTIAATDRLLTLTSCNPYPLSQGERIIAYAVLDSFTPRAAGRPDVLDYLQEG